MYSAFSTSPAKQQQELTDKYKRIQRTFESIIKEQTYANARCKRVEHANDTIITTIMRAWNLKDVGYEPSYDLLIAIDETLRGRHETTELLCQQCKLVDHAHQHIIEQIELVKRILMGTTTDEDRSSRPISRTPTPERNLEGNWRSRSPPAVIQDTISTSGLLPIKKRVRNTIPPTSLGPCFAFSSRPKTTTRSVPTV